MANILLLQSDRQLAANIQGFLNRRGHSLDTHSDPQTAVMAADKQPPDLIIIDLLLAGRSGVEFLYELRSYTEWQNIPVIVTGTLSPDEQQAYRALFAQLNVTTYLYKPSFSLGALAEEIEGIIQPIPA
jgi:two-component system response regulator PfeR